MFPLPRLQRVFSRCFSTSSSKSQIASLSTDFGWEPPYYMSPLVEAGSTLPQGQPMFYTELAKLALELTAPCSGKLIETFEASQFKSINGHLPSPLANILVEEKDIGIDKSKVLPDTEVVMHLDLLDEPKALPKPNTIANLRAQARHALNSKQGRLALQILFPLYKNSCDTTTPAAAWEAKTAYQRCAVTFDIALILQQMGFLTEASQYLSQAETLARTYLPSDHSISTPFSAALFYQRGLLHLLTSEESVPEALVMFEESIKLMPTLYNRAARDWCQLLLASDRDVQVDKWIETLKADLHSDLPEHFFTSYEEVPIQSTFTASLHNQLQWLNEWKTRPESTRGTFQWNRCNSSLASAFPPCSPETLPNDQSASPLIRPSLHAAVFGHPSPSSSSSSTPLFTSTAPIQCTPEEAANFFVQHRLSMTWPRLYSAVLFSGSGLSVASGFRTRQQFWANSYSRDACVHVANFAEDQLPLWELVQTFYADAQHRAIPSAAHVAIKNLWKRDLLHQLITQNVDGLHTFPDTPAVQELHGSLLRTICRNCGRRGSSPLEIVRVRSGAHNESIPPSEREWPPRCRYCSAHSEIVPHTILSRVLNSKRDLTVLKPDVLLFGELASPITLNYPPSHVIVAGTESDVFPASSILQKAKTHGALIMDFNTSATRLSKSNRWCDYFIQGPLEQTMPTFVDTVIKLSQDKTKPAS